MSSYCNNSDRSLQCHNSYQDSQDIGSLSHYTCPHTCVSVRDDMCQGVDWCGSDVQECGPQLRCPRIKRYLSSSLAPQHRYCSDSDTIGDEVFNSLDRSDEYRNSIDDIDMKEDAKDNKRKRSAHLARLAPRLAEPTCLLSKCGQVQMIMLGY